MKNSLDRLRLDFLNGFFQLSFEMLKVNSEGYLAQDYMHEMRTHTPTHLRYAYMAVFTFIHPSYTTHLLQHDCLNFILFFLLFRFVYKIRINIL